MDKILISPPLRCSIVISVTVALSVCTLVKTDTSDATLLQCSAGGEDLRGLVPWGVKKPRLRDGGAHRKA